jgi:hypothetical protein
MGPADRASWLGQIQRDRARRLELDVAETDLRRRRPRVDSQDDDNLEENRYLFGEKHPKAVPNLLMFIRQILDLAQTYQWSEAVLLLALNFH